MEKKNGILVAIIGILSLVLVTVGVTYAFFNYAKLGTTDNSITSGTIEFLYTEVNKVGAGIKLENALPISDTAGKMQTGSGKVFNFKVTGKTIGNMDVPYEVTARMKKDSDLDPSVVKIYLTEIVGSTEKEILLEKYDSLTQTTRVTEDIATEKTLYKGLVPTGSTNYEKEFNLRMWVDEKTDYSPVEDEEGNIVYPYNNKTFTLTVNVYADAKVVTEEEIDMANTTNIENIIVNDPNVVAEEATDTDEYDYIANVENEVNSVSLEIETTNEDATVEVTKIEEKTAYRSNVKRLSKTVNFELEEGDNLFNIRILSANKQVEDEYILNIYRALSCAFKPGDVVETFDYTGSPEEFIVPCDGIYKLEVYGAQGGGSGGKGGYSYGNVSLSLNNYLYIAVGSTTSSTTGGYNGGGVGGTNGGSNGFGYGGGGATHIARGTTNRGELKNYASYKSEVLIVAGGGGGNAKTTATMGPSSGTGGIGGGTSGGAGTCSDTAGSAYTTSGTTATFGLGGNGSSGSDLNYYAYGGGGGGYAGGIGGYAKRISSSSGTSSAAGAGGSGYIGGVTGGATSSGQRTGNGYARITLVSLK